MTTKQNAGDDRVLTDTSVWSLAFHRRNRASTADNELLFEWDALVRERRIVLIGAVRQEILTGLHTPEQYGRLVRIMRGFEDEPMLTRDYEVAAAASNTCRWRGVQGSPTDFLICAVSMRLDAPVFTSDGDFALYARHLPLRLHRPRLATS